MQIDKYFKFFGANSKKDLLQIGRVQNSLWQKETLSEAQLNHHVHIVGASGFGKTVLLSNIIRQRIHQGKGLLFVDLKGDRETLTKLVLDVSDAGRIDDLQIFSLSEKALSQRYNLVINGTATQIRDRIVSSLIWSEEFYKNQSSSFLLKLLILLCWLRDNKNLRFTLATILECASSVEKLIIILSQIPDQKVDLKLNAQELKDFLDSRDSFGSLQGLRSQIESIVLSDFGDLLIDRKDGIDLYKAYTEPKIVFLFLDSRRYGETAKTIGRLVLQDLKSVSARADSELTLAQRKPFSVIIDEFADLAQEDFLAFLDRARSSKISVVVAHQELCDLQRISPEFAGRLMGNTSTLYAFLQKRAESAETISAMAGTKKVMKETSRTEQLFFIDVPTGDKSLREVEEFNIHPNQIKSLRVGMCVCVKKYPKSRAYVVKVNIA